MNWKFWQKNTAGQAGSSHPKEAKPKDLPQSIGRHLVVEMGLDPDWVWALKSVIKERGHEKGIFDFRVFDPVAAAASQVKVTGFSALDNRTDLVLFDGWYEKNGTAREVIDHRSQMQDGHAA